jgi:hypothetical protein
MNKLYYRPTSSKIKMRGSEIAPPENPANHEKSESAQSKLHMLPNKLYNFIHSFFGFLKHWR